MKKLIFGMMVVGLMAGNGYCHEPEHFLRKISAATTQMPCQIWKEKIDEKMSSAQYISCQSDSQCTYYPSCEFGQRAINSQKFKELQDEMSRWGKMCVENNPCALKDMSMRVMEAKCVGNQCRAVEPNIIGEWTMSYLMKDVYDGQSFSDPRWMLKVIFGEDKKFIF